MWRGLSYRSKLAATVLSDNVTDKNFQSAELSRLMHDGKVKPLEVMSTTAPVHVVASQPVVPEQAVQRAQAAVPALHVQPADPLTQQLTVDMPNLIAEQVSYKFMVCRHSGRVFLYDNNGQYLNFSQDMNSALVADDVLLPTGAQQQMKQFYSDYSALTPFHRRRSANRLLGLPLSNCMPKTASYKNSKRREAAPEGPVDIGDDDLEVKNWTWDGKCLECDVMLDVSVVVTMGTPGFARLAPPAGLSTEYCCSRECYQIYQSRMR